MPTDRHQQFKAREEDLFTAAEQLLLEHGEYAMTLDLLAQHLGLAKGTLYKHIQSKDELYLHLIIRNERILLDMMDLQHDFNARLSLFVLYYLKNAHRTVLLHQIEERLATTTTGNKTGPQFKQLYSIRKQRIRLAISLCKQHLTECNSQMNVRDYLSTIWSTIYGTALLLNASFYQRYVGDRVDLRWQVLHQLLALSSTGVSVAYNDPTPANH